MSEAPVSPPPSASGRVVLLTMLAIGLVLVLSVGTFAALTRTPVKPTPPELSAFPPAPSH